MFMACVHMQMATHNPAVFILLQNACGGMLTAPKAIMELLDKLSDRVPATTPPPELAHFLKLKKHRQN